MGSLVGDADDIERRLVNAERDRRINDLSERVHATETGNGRLAEEAATARAERGALAQRLDEHDRDIESARDGVRTLILVLVGFAFTVAGSAILLALTLGNHS